MTLLDRIDADRPKRLLAVDGGGIRGVIALEILGKLQSDLRRKLRDPKLVLADVFDYISGTSTGAIIAAGLATGMSTDQLMALYVDRGAEIFSKSGWTDRLRHSYDKEALELILKDEVGADTTLGSDSLQTLLMVVLRNATTDSPWPVSNNPRARFNDRSLPDCNLDLPLWQLVRASAAAPTYFEPEVITLGDRKFVFADGCVTPFNNPAWGAARAKDQIQQKADVIFSAGGNTGNGGLEEIAKAKMKDLTAADLEAARQSLFPVRPGIVRHAPAGKGRQPCQHFVDVLLLAKELPLDLDFAHVGDVGMVAEYGFIHGYFCPIRDDRLARP